MLPLNWLFIHCPVEVEVCLCLGVTADLDTDLAVNTASNASLLT